MYIYIFEMAILLFTIFKIVSFSGSITSIGEERADFSAIAYS